MIINPVANTAAFDAPNYAVAKAATNAVFTLDRLGNGSGPLTVYFSTRPGTATAGSDYIAVNPENLPTSSLTPVSWADGDLSPKTVSVQILNSGSTSNKTFVVALNDGLAPRVAGSGTPPYSRAGVVILSTNATTSPGILAFTGYSGKVSAGYADTGAAYSVPATNESATLEVSRTYGSSGPVSISYATTVAGTAAPGVDYTAVNGTLSWADGDTTNKTFTVPIANNPSETSNLTVWVELSNPTGGAIGGMPYAALLTIGESNLNDTTSPSLIVQQPNETVTQGQNATFSVVASGSPPLNYQWQKNGANLVGATNATYVINAAQNSDIGTYTVVVSNSAGNVWTTGALLTVNPFQITNVNVNTNGVLITWTTIGGQTNVVQATTNLTQDFTNISANIFINGTGVVATNFLDPSAVTNLPSRFYRIQVVQ